jgi:hypothetical protein
MFKNIFFYLPISVDVIGIMVALYFIFDDLSRYGSSKNGSLLLVTLLMGAWIGFCFYLRTTKVPALGTILAWIPATPLLLYGVFILLFMILKPDMK